MDPLELARGVGAAAIAVGVILAFAWGLGAVAARRDMDAPPAAAAFALSAGAFLAHGVWFGFDWRPTESWAGILSWWVAAGVLSPLAVQGKPSAALRAGVLTTLIALGWVLVFRKALFASPGGVDLARWALFAAVPASVALLWGAALPRLGAAGVGLSLALLASVASVLFLCAGSLKLCFSAAAIAGGAGALTVALVLRPSAGGAAGAVLPCALGLSLLGLCAVEYTYASYSLHWLLAPALAPLAAFLPRPRGLAARLALMAAVSAPALFVALRAYSASVY